MSTNSQPEAQALGKGGGLTADQAGSLASSAILSHSIGKDRIGKGHSQKPHHDTNDKLYLYSK